jgi:hydroxymethylglutaryl-CoA reductase (NADPH)
MNKQILNLLKNIKPYNYENNLIKNNIKLNNNILEECVNLRRKQYNITDLPYQHFNYEQNLNRNCENIIGYTRIPTGIIGPVNIHNKTNYVPIATTEGALISSINRGCKLLNTSKTSIVVEDVGMTRSPIIKCNSLNEVVDIKKWITYNFNEIKIIFEIGTKFTKLKTIDFLQEGRHLHIRFTATTGDAMGMNMVSKSSNAVLKYLQSTFSFEIVSLSGNTCTDKKSSAINLIKGRGKNVIMDAVITKDKLQTILNVSPEQMINLNIQKNLIGSSLAGTIGGNNCNASNIIAGIFIATGQDCGQIGTSSYCLLNMTKENEDLLVTINMPALEIGTIGGGTHLDDQYNNLKLMGIDSNNKPGENVSILAKNIIYSVLSCELSLMSALCNDDLVKAHLKLNRGIKY